MCIANLPDELSLVGPASRLASVCPKSIGLWSAMLKSRDWKQQPEVTQQASVYLGVTCWPTSRAGMWNAPVHSLVCVTIVPGDVCKCYRTCVRWCRREKEVCAWVDIVIKAPLMHLCSNKLRTWEECKCCDIYFFFFPLPPAKPNQRLCDWAVQTGHTCPLLHLGPPVAFNGFKNATACQVGPPRWPNTHKALSSCHLLTL